MNKNRFIFAICLGLVFLLFSFIKNDTEPLPKEKFVVVLDAGHGGHDPGNLGNGYLEKNIALSIVLKAGQVLEKYPDVEVIYTRKDDSFVDLYKRGEIANKANADLFVSVHCDSHSSNAYGMGTFVLGLHANRQNFEVAKKENSVIYLEDNYEQRYSEYDINSPESVIGLTIMQEEFLDQSIELAKLLQDNFAKKLKRKDRKVKQAGFIVLHQTFMPSVLVETGFLTNKDEGRYLNSEKGQREVGTAIADAILSYKNGFDANLVEEQTVQDNPLEKAGKAVVEQTRVDQKPKTEEQVTEKKETQTEPTPKSNAPKNPLKTIVFKVQLLASSKSIPLKPGNFKGLDKLSSEPYKTMYRYLYGNTSSYEEAEKLKAEANARGYTTSYIVAYQNGKRISVKEALNSASTQ